MKKEITFVTNDREFFPPLYARIDGVMVDGTFRVMEIEGVEPYMEMQEAMQTDPAKNVIGKYVQAIDEANKKRALKHSI